MDIVGDFMIREIEEKIGELKAQAKDPGEIKAVVDTYRGNLQAYDKVLLSRHEKRPKALDFIENLIDNRMFFSGDRCFGDDKALLGGIGYLDQIPITFLGTAKGKNLEENLNYNFGMLRPEGYRKSLRLMKQAEKFGRPIISFIDTPGAYPGIDAEERGQAEAIARNIMEMANLKVPIIAVFTGEGGSGGALALAVSNRIIMMEFSIFSILSPEGFATILWKDSSRYREASSLMKLSAEDLYSLKIVDRVIKEDIVFDLEDYGENFARLRQALVEELGSLMKKSGQALVLDRYEKFRSIGVETWE